MTELILNSNEHIVDVNKLKYEFESPIRFDNSFISLTQDTFYNFFHNVKQNYEMKVTRDNTYYNIIFIDSMLEVEDINKIINDELIRHKLLTEDDPPIISIIPDINTFKIIVLVERSYELYLDVHTFSLIIRLKIISLNFQLLSIYTYYIQVQEKISLLDIRFCCRLNSLHHVC